MAAIALDAPKPISPTWRNFRDALRRHPTAIAGGVVLLVMILIAILAPWLGTVDPQAVAPVKRLKQPGAQFWFGSDMMGRDVYSRVLYGARVSLTIGIAVALFSTLVGLAIGLVTGYVRWMDAVVMRVMDGLMSIPPVLLAIALMALTRASMGNVILAITLAETPRVVRLVRGTRASPDLEAGVMSQPPSPPAAPCHASSGATSCRTSWRRCWCKPPMSAPPR